MGCNPENIGVGERSLRYSHPFLSTSPRRILVVNKPESHFVSVMRRCALTTQVSLLKQPTERSTILYSLKRQVELFAACASRSFLPFDILVFGLTIFT